MKLFSKISLAIVFICASPGAFASAQNNEIFRMNLAEPDTTAHAVVRIIEHGTASDVLRKYNSDAVTENTVPGFRVCIFFGNGQNARREGEAVREKFRKQFPDIPTYFAYETPAWMLNVGNCVTKEESMILLGRLTRRYPRDYRSAYIRNENIPINEFLRTGDQTEDIQTEGSDDQLNVE